MDSQKKRLDLPALTAVRGVAALWVVLYHLHYEVSRLFPGFYDIFAPVFKSGYLGVDLFFVLSGFVIALNYQTHFHHFKWSAYKQFLIKRLARIYPVYLASLLLTVLVVGGYILFDFKYRHMDRFTWIGLLQSITMTQALIFPIPRVWNVVAWSVSAEWAAYLSFPLLAFCAQRLPRNVTRVLAMVLVCCLYVLVMYHLKRPSAMEVGLVRVAGGFSMGVMICNLRTILPATFVKSRGWLLLGCLCLALGPCYYSLTMKIWVSSLIWAPMAFVPVVFALAQPGAQSGFLVKPLWLYLGRISYSLYMVHAVVFMAIRAIYSSKLLVDAHGVIQIGYVLMDIALVIFIAHLFYGRIEEPCRRWLLKKYAS